MTNTEIAITMLIVQLKEKGLMLETDHQTANKLVEECATAIDLGREDEIHRAVKMTYENNLIELDNDSNIFNKMGQSGIVSIYLNHKLSKF